MSLLKASNDELRQEIERRKIALTKPDQILFSLTDESMFKLQKRCQFYIDSLAGGERYKDPEEHIFEAAIELCFGKNIWDWINKRLE